MPDRSSLSLFDFAVISLYLPRLRGSMDLSHLGIQVPQPLFLSGEVENVTRGKSIRGKPLAPLLAEIVIAGGVIPMLLKEGFINEEPFAASAS